MRTQDIIRKKRDAENLTDEEISFLIGGIADGSIPSYQASAFLMAVRLNGMTDEETVSLTKAMIASGSTLDVGDITGPKIDKHSTGGVGDKPSIILAPLIAVMGVKVPMISGRGLGHTGGTLDKLESIPGFRHDLSRDEYRESLNEVGAFIMGQTDTIAPADRILYSLRDVTATVDSIPLIASSIMSKKLAEGTDGLVLDVKTGSAAFIEDYDEARRLASLMVDIGNSMGVRTVALLTVMDQPLGRAVGNALEIRECISALKGKWPADLSELTLTLAAYMLYLADAASEGTGIAPLSDFALRNYRHEAFEFIEKGDAFSRFVELIDAQNGDPETAFSPNKLPVASKIIPVSARADGYIRKLDAKTTGTASMLLGAGRKRVDDTIDHSAGIILNKKVGDRVKADDPIAVFHLNDERLFNDAEEVFMSGVEIGKTEIAGRPLVREVIIRQSKNS